MSILQNNLTVLSLKNRFESMRLFVSLFLILSLLASTAFSTVDLCDSVKNTQQKQFLSAPESDLAEIDTHQSHSHDDNKSSHEHCDLHCTHHNVLISVHFPLVYSLENSLKNSIYVFSFSQTFLESPFRPPLV